MNFKAGRETVYFQVLLVLSSRLAEGQDSLPDTQLICKPRRSIAGSPSPTHDENRPDKSSSCLFWGTVVSMLSMLLEDTGPLAGLILPQ